MIPQARHEVIGRKAQSKALGSAAQILPYSEPGVQRRWGENCQSRDTQLEPVSDFYSHRRSAPAKEARSAPEQAERSKEGTGGNESKIGPRF